MCGRYFLKAESGNIYITRGGKRKFYIEGTFLYNVLIKDHDEKDKDNILILTQLKEVVNKTLKNSKLGQRTKNSLEQIETLLNGIVI